MTTSTRLALLPLDRMVVTGSAWAATAATTMKTAPRRVASDGRRSPRGVIALPPAWNGDGAEWIEHVRGAGPARLEQPQLGDARTLLRQCDDEARFGPAQRLMLQLPRGARRLRPHETRIL